MTVTKTLATRARGTDHRSDSVALNPKPAHSASHDTSAHTGHANNHHELPPGALESWLPQGHPAKDVPHATPAHLEPVKTHHQSTPMALESSISLGHAAKDVLHANSAHPKHTNTHHKYPPGALESWLPQGHAAKNVLHAAPDHMGYANTHHQFDPRALESSLSPGGRDHAYSLGRSHTWLPSGHAAKNAAFPSYGQNLHAHDHTPGTRIRSSGIYGRHIHRIHDQARFGSLDFEYLTHGSLHQPRYTGPAMDPVRWQHELCRKRYVDCLEWLRRMHPYDAEQEELALLWYMIPLLPPLRRRRQDRRVRRMLAEYKISCGGVDRVVPLPPRVGTSVDSGSDLEWHHGVGEQVLGILRHDTTLGNAGDLEHWGCLLQDGVDLPDDLWREWQQIVDRKIEYFERLKHRVYGRNARPTPYEVAEIQRMIDHHHKNAHWVRL